MSLNNINHYDWLETNLQPFFENVGVNWEGNKGIIVAHGDKGYSYKCQWEEAGIPFTEGMAVYLLSYVSPYCNEVRETPNGWVDPGQWVIDNYHRFKNKINSK